MQTSLDLDLGIASAEYEFGARASGHKHGVVLTRRRAVDLVLDLAGYTQDAPLHQLRLLEPSCGEGAFVVEAARRLFAAATRDRIPAGQLVNQLARCIRAFDIDPGHVARSRSAVRDTLASCGASPPDASILAQSWIQQGDFLVHRHTDPFDFVVGNPPYVRIEQISPRLRAEYRARYRTLFDRADLYVAFFELGLSLLTTTGVLAYVCADRWILNRYGRELRSLVTQHFGVRAIVGLHDAAPFESDVIAYPAVFVIGRDPQVSVAVASIRAESDDAYSALTRALHHGDDHDSAVDRVPHRNWFRGEEPWVLSNPAQRDALTRLEASFSPLEHVAKVGIGVASGCDRVYLVNANADIEPDRLVPVVMRGDITNGRITDARRCVINTFHDDGTPIRLSHYPRLKQYFDAHDDAIRRRKVAARSGEAWFRTIDRVYPELVTTPKLLIPDIAGANELTFDDGRYHPHHNLYYVTSSRYDLEVLGGLLASRVALFFVWSYALKMRGGYLRFQAQYLRRIRVPAPETLPPKLTSSLKAAFRDRDFAALDKLACEAYQIAHLPHFDFVDTR